MAKKYLPAWHTKWELDHDVVRYTDGTMFPRHVRIEPVDLRTLRDMANARDVKLVQLIPELLHDIAVRERRQREGKRPPKICVKCDQPIEEPVLVDGEDERCVHCADPE